MPMKAPDGSDATAYTDSLINAALPTEADGLAIMLDQLDRITTRTSQGVDYNNTPFVPYSTGGKHTLTVPKGPGRSRRQKQIAKKSGGRPIASSYNIVYRGYSGYKLGRTGTDTVNLKLTGDMLNALTAQSGSLSAPVSSNPPDPSTVSAPVGQPEIGIYVSPLDQIAEGHNEGSAILPQRRFLDSNPDDIEQMGVLIVSRIETRAQRLVK